MESRGEVRRMADAFAEGDVEAVSSHLQSALHSHRQTLQTLEAFLHDNQQLTKLVQDLPNKVSHSIMVPFGKAAFFPGRLVHTNEFLVLLGEGYYAECSSSKTLDILARRGEFLGSQIAGVNSQLADLDVESRFFTETLAEAAAGYVEIREELDESLASDSASGSALNSEIHPIKVPAFEGSSSISMIKERGLDNEDKEHVDELEAAEANERGLDNEDKEHELLMARLDELEAAEAAANLEVSLEDNDCRSSGDTTELQPSEQDDVQCVTNARQKIADDVARETLSVNGPDQRAPSTDYDQVKVSANFYGGSLEARPSLQSPGDLLKFEEWRRFITNEVNLNSSAEAKRKISTLPLKKQEAHHSEESTSSRQLTQAALMSPTETQRNSETLRTNKAFTGAVLERSGPSCASEHSQGPTEVKKRPTSKFKMRQTEK